MNEATESLFPPPLTSTELGLLPAHRGLLPSTHTRRLSLMNSLLSGSVAAHHLLLPPRSTSAHTPSLQTLLPHCAPLLPPRTGHAAGAVCPPPAGPSTAGGGRNIGTTWTRNRRRTGNSITGLPGKPGSALSLKRKSVVTKVIIVN